MNDGYINTDVMSITQTKLDVPADAPVLYVTRDVYEGKPARKVDVWTARPTRKCMRDAYTIVYCESAAEMCGEKYLGAFTPDAVREALGFVPAGDECIVIDNPRVN